jgi:hypothetical protein
LHMGAGERRSGCPSELSPTPYRGIMRRIGEFSCVPPTLSSIACFRGHPAPYIVTIFGALTVMINKTDMGVTCRKSNYLERSLWRTPYRRLLLSLQSTSRSETPLPPCPPMSPLILLHSGILVLSSLPRLRLVPFPHACMAVLADLGGWKICHPS